jgi:hypothetical protein
LRRRTPVILLAAFLAAAICSTAFAFDCIRVSSSAQGLAASTRSGNWLPFDFGSPEGTATTLGNLGIAVDPDAAACFTDAYADSGQPQYFALGIGVAGGKKESTNSQGVRAQDGGFGVIAWNNDGPSIQDGHGIDHLEQSPILGAVISAATGCGIDLGEPGDE